jgi:hypothetical protein
MSVAPNGVAVNEIKFKGCIRARSWSDHLNERSEKSGRYSNRTPSKKVRIYVLSNLYWLQSYIRAVLAGMTQKDTPIRSTYGLQGWDVLGLIPSMSIFFSLLYSFQTGSGGPPRFLFSGYRGRGSNFSGYNAAEALSWPWSVFIAEVKMGRALPPLSHMCYLVKDKGTLLFWQNPMIVMHILYMYIRVCTVARVFVQPWLSTAWCHVS